MTVSKNLMKGGLYQKTGWSDFDKLQVTDCTLATNKRIRAGKMVHRALSHNEHHKTCNGWYSGMVAPIYSIVGILILYNKNVLGL